MKKGIWTKYHLFLALKHGQSKQVAKKLRYIQVLCYSFLLAELVFALRKMFPCRVQHLSPSLNCWRKKSGGFAFALLHKHKDNN